MIDGIVSYHMNPFASGVARFNELLANGLDLPLLSILDPRTRELERPLLSFKVREVAPDELPVVEATLDALRSAEIILFLHDFVGLPLEERMCREAIRIYCGNHAIERDIAKFAARSTTLWTPGLVLDRRPFRPVDLSVFSFGMAHKIQTSRFRRLRDLLDETGLRFAIYVSTATHATSSPRDAESIFTEMHEIFPDELFFLGNLSDVAVSNYLRRTTFFASFFPDGVRANNTSISSALDHGAVVITNLDGASPPWLRHMDNVIDIEQVTALPTDELELKKISVAALETSRGLSWAQLFEVFGVTHEVRA